LTKIQVDAGGNAPLQESVLNRCDAHPCRIEEAGRIGEAVVPFSFEPVQVIGFAAGHGHVTLRSRHFPRLLWTERSPRRAAETGNRQENAGRTEKESEENPWAEYARLGR
jgi:hypothetical protein